MMTMPTFVCTFADGEVTRMTTHCAGGLLNVERGVRLARYAYESRKGKMPPKMAKAAFVSAEDGTVLKAYGASDLNGSSAAYQRR